MAREYKKLNKVANYDREAAEELAEALNELAEIEARAAHLKELVNENPELHSFVWRTASNKTIALHKIEDSHLTNIMTRLLATGRPISREIRAEATSRNIAIPTASVSSLLIEAGDYEGDEPWQD